jgi:Fe-S cluster assembly protein SufD
MKKIYVKGNADWYLNLFKDFENGLNGQTSSDLHALRKSAIDRFHDLGFPAPGNEEWKYTNIDSLLSYDFRLASASQAAEKLSVTDKSMFAEDKESLQLVFVNGYFREDLSNTGKAERHIEILNLKQAIDANHPVLAEHFGKYAIDDTESFVAMNTAFTQDGALIIVGDEMVVDKPVHLLYLSLPEKTPAVSFPRNLILSGRSSELCIVETYAALEEGLYFSNCVSEISVGENARLERIKIQIESEKAYHISTLQVNQAQNSHFTDHNINFGAGLSRNNITSLFKGTGAETMLNGLYVGNHTQHMDNHTSIDHAGPHCESHELYKGILDQKARGVFNGKIFVRPDAQKTNAIQSNNCILLSDEATIDTKPQLEIFADDVKCTHGATIGQLDEDAFFYMRARGIEQSRARKMLIYAFASEVVDRIKQDDLREKISHLFENKLEKARLD